MQYSIIIFDGLCHFCSKWVIRLIKLDRQAKFRFAPLQSKIAQEMLRFNQRVSSQESLILIEAGRIYTESTAVLRICKQLGGIWRVLYGLIVIPPFIRDPIYRWIARNRYRWFGKREVCLTPSAEIRARFLHDQAE